MKERYFKIEKDTHLQIWEHKESIFIRIDCYKQYSIPLSNEKYHYIQPNLTVKKLIDNFGFESPISKANDIYKIASELKEVDNIKEW